MLKSYFTCMLKSSLTLRLRWLEQNSAYMEQVKECGHARGKKPINTSTYHPSYCMMPYVSEMRSSTVEANAGEKQGWMGRKNIPVHTHSSLGRKEEQKMQKECMGLGHKGDES